jgi:hypothetical protein
MKLSSFILFLIFAVGGIFLVTVGFGTTFPFTVYLALFIMLIAIIPILGFTAIVKKERYYAQEDMIVPKSDRAKHLSLIGILSLIAIVGSLAFSSNKSAFPPITGFLFRFFKYNTPPEIETEIAPVETPSVLGGIFSSLQNIEQLSPLPVRKLLQYGFIILLAAWFVLLVFVPRFYRNKFSQNIPVINDGVFASIIGWFRSVLLALSSVFKTKKPLKRNKSGAAEILQTVKKIMASYSAEKKQTMRESVTLFAQLIIWGNNVRKVFWKPAHAPAEYCGLLTAASPEWNLNRGIIRCGQLFEQALYSPQVLSNEERKEFTGLVKEITAE